MYSKHIRNVWMRPVPSALWTRRIQPFQFRDKATAAPVQCLSSSSAPPIAISNPISSTQAPSSSVSSVSGGVWAPTSAKRDKLAELAAELKWDKHQRSLNDVATIQEKMDLHLIEGLSVLLEDSDTGNTTRANMNIQTIMEDLNLYLQQLEANFPNHFITQEQYAPHLQQILDFVTETKLRYFTPADATSPLVYLRDFCVYDASKDNNIKDFDLFTSSELASLTLGITQPLAQCQLYLQLTLLESCIKLFIQSGWKEFMIPSDTELDRQAAQDTITTSSSSSSSPPPRGTQRMNVKKLHTVLLSHLQGSCSDRIQALWNLKDGDDDTRIEKEHLESLILWAIRPVQDTFYTLVSTSLSACPVRLSPDDSSYPYDVQQEQTFYRQEFWYYLSSFSRFLSSREEEQHQQLQDISSPTTTIRSSTSFRSRYKNYQNRKEMQRVQKYMMKYVNKTIRYHFDREVELPHRLRCIYAWADKEHQQGKVESVLIPDTPVLLNPNSLLSLVQGQRKRFVELEPKISFLEFQSMQKIHLAHLDRIGGELCTSLKEEVWIHQGKKRQGVEFRKEAMIFLSLVTVIDFIIMIS